MKRIGIICEYNPFHNGHIYHIEKIKEMFPQSEIIAVMSGCFTQRGNISLIEKYTKADIALKYGIDLVVELPFIFSTQSADIFSDAAISILDKLNTEYIVFGSESNDIHRLQEIAKAQLNNDKYNKEVKLALSSGDNYPTAIMKALNKISGFSTSSPNDLLGISYIKSILKQKSSIIPLSIKRTNDFHSTTVSNSNIVSAALIRKNIKEKKSIQEFVPPEIYEILNKNKCNYDYNYYNLLKYKIISEGTSIKKYLTVDEGIENRILKYIDDTDNLEDLISKVKSKRFTYNKLSRMFTHILCSLEKDTALKNKEIKYIRVLSFNKVGQKILNSVKKKIDIPIITTVKYYKDLLDYDIKIEKIYKAITK